MLKSIEAARLVREWGALLERTELGEVMLPPRGAFMALAGFAVNQIAPHGSKDHEALTNFVAGKSGEADHLAMIATMLSWAWLVAVLDERANHGR